MANLFKIAIRNLLRYRRRTLLTASLITIGVVFVLVFISVSGSFKAMMIGQITDSMIGHLQVHRKGYVASIDNLPLNMNLRPNAMKKVEAALGSLGEVESASPRIKFGGMFSNFAETTNIRLNGVYPDREFKTVPLLPSRITEGKAAIEKGEILIPDPPRPGDGGQGRRRRCHCGHQQGRLGQRKAVQGGGPDGKRHGSRGPRRLRPYRGRRGAPAHDGDGDQRDRHSTEGFRQTRIR